jgi:DNA repair exonuclease SbcCD ATPase subunit
MLNINNFYSHADSSIDFSSFNSALLIGNTEGDYDKSNGSGKSSIFEAILWCLFNKSRASMIDDIITWGKNSCSVELLFHHKDILYKVVRVRRRASSTSSVEFSKMHNDEWVDISGSTSGDTSNRIEDLIGLDFKTFINSIYFRQSDISEFAESDPSRKKDVLKKMMDISKWDDYEKISKAKLKEAHFNIDLLKISIQDLSKKKGELDDNKLKLSKERDSLKVLSSERNTIESNIEKLNKRYLIAKNNLDTDSYDNAIDNIKAINDGLERQGLKLKRLLIKSNSYKDEISTLAGDIKSETLSMSDLIEDLDAEEKLSESNSNLINKKTSYKSLNEYLSHLESVLILKDKCYSCGQNISEDLYLLLLDKHNNKKSDYLFKVNAALKELSKIERSISLYAVSIDANKRIKIAGDKVKALSSKLSINKDRLSEILSEIADCESFIAKANSDLDVNKNILDSLKDDDFTSLRATRVDLLSRKKELISDIADSNKNIGILSEKASSLTREVGLVKDKRSELDSLLNSAQVLDKLTKMLGKGGIQAILLDAVIEELEAKSNEILSFISNEPTSIVLDTQRVGSDGVSVIETLDLKVNMNGINQNFKSLSGGEQFRISLALRIALSEIASVHGGSSLEFLLLDEVNSPLDKNGVDNLFKNVISSLEDRYKILIITHDSSLQEKFLNVIDVTKINGESSVSCSFI